MNQSRATNARVVAIDPTSRGFGFAVLEGPDRLIDWGVKATRQDKEKQTLAKIEELIEHYAPDVLVLEDFSAEKSHRSERIRHLLERTAELVKSRGIRIRRFSAVQVRNAVAGDERVTKHQMARIIAERFPELADRLPRYRKPWMSEDYRQNIFDAVGLGVAFFQKSPDRGSARSLIRDS